MFILRSLWLFFLDFLETIVVSLAVFALVYIFLFQPHQVDGHSMEPNFHNGEYILTDKVSYRLHAPSRGDVVVFHSPQDERVDFIKRIIGLPGETVEIRGGKVYVNGMPLEEEFLRDSPSYVFEPTRVPQGNYFVLGDNRNNSSDSHVWGMVPEENIIGRAWVRYWPPDALGLFPSEHLLAGN